MPWPAATIAAWSFSNRYPTTPCWVKSTTTGSRAPSWSVNTVTTAWTNTATWPSRSVHHPALRGCRRASSTCWTSAPAGRTGRKWPWASAAMWGVELSEERARHGRSVGLRVVGLDDLQARRFRFINTEQVFEHLTEPRLVLEKLRNALSGDGVIKISVPDAAAALKKSAREKFRRAVGRRPDADRPAEHIKRVQSRFMVAFGKVSGLKPLPGFTGSTTALGPVQPQKPGAGACRPSIGTFSPNNFGLLQCVRKPHSPVTYKTSSKASVPRSADHGTSHFGPDVRLGLMRDDEVAPPRSLLTRAKRHFRIHVFMKKFRF